MWLRDSSAQVFPYIPYAKEDPQLSLLLEGVIRRQTACIKIDPYANAFNKEATGSEWVKDDTRMLPELHERKWEIDSLCYPIRLAYHYWKATGNTSVFDTEWKAAMVNGYAIGGGHVLQVVCDLSIASDNAIFGQTGPRVGSFDAGFGSSYLARIVGQKKAREIWFLCRQYNAQQALEMGLVNTVVPFDQLEDETVKWAHEMMQHSPMAMAFDFFNISGSLFVETEAKPEIRASAQGLFMMMTNGLGAIMGGYASGAIVDLYSKYGEGGMLISRNWPTIWFIFAGYAMVIAVLFALFFKYKHKAQSI